MSAIWTGSFWKATAERAIATAAQAALAVVGADELLNVLEVGWPEVGAVAAGGFVLAVLKAVAANGLTHTGPGLTQAEHVTDGPRHRADV